jgi:hypothetical protein
MGFADRKPVDRKGWAAGPWDKESDFEEWTTETGYRARLVRNSLGNWCGYVRVERGHPAFYVHYGIKPLDDVAVHGGLTWSDTHDGDEDAWWLGFDCAHAFDYMPGMRPLLRQAMGSSGIRPGEHYRDEAYCREECEKLAKQLLVMVYDVH